MSYKERYHYCKEHGICPQCSQKHDSGTVLCQNCYQKQYGLHKERYHRRAAAGLCVDCGKKAIDGTRHCQEHKERSSARIRKYRTQKKEKGICQSCAGPAVNGGIFCEKHRVKNNKWRTSRNRIRKQQGTCIYCGGQNDTTTQVCTVCYYKYKTLKKEPRVPNRLVKFFGTTQCSIAEFEEKCSWLRNIINKSCVANILDERHKDILQARFVDEKFATLQEVATKHGVSRERIRQQEEKIILLLQNIIDIRN